MKLIKKITASPVGSRYINDRAFRGSVSIYQGTVVSLAFAVFKAVTGILYSSVWLIATAAYFFLLGAMRAWLAVAYRKKEKRGGFKYERLCYRRIAWLLFILNIPMGFVIFLTIKQAAIINYPWYTIYASAAYTFYMMTLSIINLVKYRKLGSPILSAAKVLNFVAAMMSLLGLQDALIISFAEDNQSTSFRPLMNTLTGAGIYVIVIITALYMLLHKEVEKEIE